MDLSHLGCPAQIPPRLACSRHSRRRGCTPAHFHDTSSGRYQRTLSFDQRGPASRPRLALYTRVASPVAPAQQDVGSSSEAQQRGPADIIPNIWAELAAKHGSNLASRDPHHQPVVQLTFRELKDQMQQFAAGLQSLGLRQNDKVSLFSENSIRWLIADQGIMMNGAIDAVRGASSPRDEMAYIMRHSQSSAVVLQDPETLDKLLPVLSEPADEATSNGAGKPLHEAIKFAICLWGEPSKEVRNMLACNVLSFQDVLDEGAAAAAGFQMANIQRNDLATFVYTSGTTGNPKGVMLTHANLFYQIENMSHYIRPDVGDTSLSLLPPWHIYERACGYYLYYSGSSQVYTNVRRFRDDLTKYPPSFFVCVPLVLDSLYNKVQGAIKRGNSRKKAIAKYLQWAGQTYIRQRRIVQGLSLHYARTARPFLVLLRAFLACGFLYPFFRLAQILVYAKVRTNIGIKKAVISGGGSLVASLDDFFEALGLPILNGWGLTETSPVLACRRDLPGKNVRGSTGFVMPMTEVRVVNPESYEDLPDGQQGLLLARGPGVMAGYYNDEENTKKAFAPGNGWFDTGDLGWRAPEGVPGSNMAGNLVLAGRIKDTIVLSNGENVEPQPIEDACSQSNFIQFIVLYGQDRRALGALVCKNEEAFEELEKSNGKMSDKQVHDLLRAEINKATAERPPQDTIAALVVLKQPFTPEDGTLTRTMKPRRQVIFDKYAAEVEKLNASIRP